MQRFNCLAIVTLRFGQYRLPAERICKDEERDKHDRPNPFAGTEHLAAGHVDESRFCAARCFLGDDRDRDRVWKSAMFAILNGRGEMAERLKAAVC